jgi:hypothetical protein
MVGPGKSGAAQGGPGDGGSPFLFTSSSDFMFFFFFNKTVFQILGFNTRFFISLLNRILFVIVYLLGHTLGNLIALVSTSTLTLGRTIDEKSGLSAPPDNRTERKICPPNTPRLSW